VLRLCIVVVPPSETGGSELWVTGTEETRRLVPGDCTGWPVRLVWQRLASVVMG
jgi:hypothetical protein